MFRPTTLTVPIASPEDYAAEFTKRFPNGARAFMVERADGFVVHGETPETIVREFTFDLYDERPGTVRLMAEADPISADFRTVIIVADTAIEDDEGPNGILVTASGEEVGYVFTADAP